MRGQDGLGRRETLESVADEAVIRPEIRALVERGNVTCAEVAKLRCNSWEWAALVPAYDDEVFLERVEHTLANCSSSRKHMMLYGPELLKRFRFFLGQLFDGGYHGKCVACDIEAEIGTEENPHPVPRRFHVCKEAEGYMAETIKEKEDS